MPFLFSKNTILYWIKQSFNDYFSNLSVFFIFNNVIIKIIQIILQTIWQECNLCFHLSSKQIQSWHRCISLKYDFYKDGASWRQNIKQRLNVMLRRSPPYQKAQEEWSCWTPTKSGSFEMCVFLRWMGLRCICSVSQEVSFFVTKSTFVFAWLILYICGFIEYVSGIF